jgi:tetrahydromethanopterin S-methyltransferase subunit A
MANDADDEIDQDAIENPLIRQMLERLDAMSDEALERFVRMTERVAALPVEVQANITEEMMDYMFENDVDYPFN